MKKEQDYMTIVKNKEKYHWFYLFNPKNIMITTSTPKNFKISKKIIKMAIRCEWYRRKAKALVIFDEKTLNKFKNKEGFLEGYLGDLPRIELFARIKTDGWDVWGNEVESDITLTKPL